MNRLVVIFYAAALVLHAVVLFALKPSPPLPPKIMERTFIDVALTAPSQPEPPKPLPVPPPPKEVPPPEPKPETKPEPQPEPPPPKAEMTIPTPTPEPPPPPVEKPVVVPQPKPSQEYVRVTQPTYAKHADPIYPDQARRWHQQGIVVLVLFINELGALDRVEIVKSSGFPLLDDAAVKAMKQSQFAPARDGTTPIRSRAEATVTFRLE